MKQSIQTLRGLACIFLVAYHTVGSAPDRGLMMGDGTLLRHLAESFVYLRMPLFAFVAGLVYTFRSVTPGQPVAPFMLGKARRLLIPMLVVGSTQFFFQTLAKGFDLGHLAEALWIPIFPYEHFWFLQAIFVIFALVAFLDSFGVLVQRIAVVIGLFLAAAIASMDLIQTELLSIRGALYLLPFFFLGLYFGRFGDPLARRGGVPIAWALVAIGVIVTQAGLFGYLDGPLPREAPLGLLFGAAFCMLIIRTGWTNSKLEFIGKYSYGIYLFHMFGVAGLRMILPKIGIDQPYLMFVIMLAGGLSLPILVEQIASRFNLTRMLLLGQKPLPKAKPSPPGSTDEVGATAR
ncbi:MAG TPA: acyltransferase [Geminicoccus sp.]|uniref:acyltransferase family protein n=1 Tax=Geminicoccus sp. TaxID=2024832 RepID=UPI002E2F8F5C|nr:acyltransferase [Geminicoccus sp.]HEX2526210.1 acyltransferase [Geminicoccus sp.]